jgi:hypothetical protein
MASPGVEMTPQLGTAYGMRRDVLLSASGTPCNPPPWGVLEAVSLADGTKKWESPLGHIPAFERLPASRTWGSMNLGGAMITGGGLVFASGGFDSELHAFDIDTGHELWQAKLPAGGNAMPMTYQTANGKQYVVISAGGHDRLRTPLGDYVVAFALPGSRAAPPSKRLASVTGAYEGEMRISPNRFPTTWRLVETNGVLTGTMAAMDAKITGELKGTRQGDTLNFIVTFRFPEKNCGGTFESKGEVSNGGKFIEGLLTVKSNCSDRDEPGTWIMRPK